MSLHFHFDGEIPESRKNRDSRLVCAVIQLNDRADLTGGVERGAAGLTQGCRLSARCDDRRGAPPQQGRVVTFGPYLSRATNGIV